MVQNVHQLNFYSLILKLKRVKISTRDVIFTSYVQPASAGIVGNWCSVRMCRSRSVDNLTEETVKHKRNQIKAASENDNKHFRDLLAQR